MTEVKRLGSGYDVVVLLPIFNNLTGLLLSLKSIAYDAEKLAVVIVDDGSEIPITANYIEANWEKGFALKVITLNKNSGITAALNKGLQWIGEHLETKYIARLDGGDVCHEERFYRQVSFLEQHQDVGLLGSWCKFCYPGTTKGFVYKTPVAHAEIMAAMHSRNVFIHPTVMFRSTLLKETGFYPEGYQYVEDYALFFKMLQHMKGAVLARILVTCEINPKGLSQANRKKQLQGRNQVVQEFGTETWLKLKGKIKLLILQIIPYQFVVKIKRKLRGKA